MNENSKKKSHRKILTIWLYLIIIFNASSLVLLLFVFSDFSSTLTSISPERAWELPIAIVIMLLNIVFAVYLLKWKKWAFWGFCITGVISFIAGVFFGVAPHLIVDELIYPVIIYFLLRPQWHLLE